MLNNNNSKSTCCRNPNRKLLSLSYNSRFALKLTFYFSKNNTTSKDKGKTLGISGALRTRWVIVRCLTSNIFFSLDKIEPNCQITTPVYEC